MDNSRNRLILCLYVVAAVIFFSYSLFPAEAVKAYITKKMNTISPILSITIDHANPTFPPGVGLDTVNLYHENTSLFSIDQMRITPNILSMFREKKTFFFKGKAHKGILKGRVDISEEGPGGLMGVYTQVSKIEINDIPFIQNIAAMKLSGVINGKAAYSRNEKTGGSGTADISVTGVSIAIYSPIFNQGNLDFSSVDAELEIKGHMLKLNRCAMIGNQIDGRLSGSITLDEPIGESLLNLRGTIIPQPALFEDPRKDLMEIFHLKKERGVSRFSLRITGTIDTPAFFWE